MALKDYTQAFYKALPAMCKSAYTYVTVGVQTIVSASSMHVIHQELKEYGGLKNIVYQILDKLSSLLGKNNPLSEIQGFVDEIEKNGGAKQFFNKKIEHKKKHCADKAKMTVEEVDNLVKCMITSIKSEGDLIKKGENFAECTGINIFNMANEFKEMSTLTQCFIKDLQATTKKARATVAHLTKEINLNQLSETIAKIEKDGLLKASIQKEIKSTIEVCAHNIGGDLEEAQDKIICFEQMSESKGAMQKIQSFVRCNNITIDDVVDEVQNTVALVQCVGQEMEKSFVSMSVDVDGNAL
jgi:hypothetical protein